MLEVLSNPLRLSLDASQMRRGGFDKLQLRARRSQLGHRLFDVGWHSPVALLSDECQSDVLVGERGKPALNLIEP